MRAYGLREPAAEPAAVGTGSAGRRVICPAGITAVVKQQFEVGQQVAVRKALLPPHAPYGHRLVIDLVDPEVDSAPPASPPALAPGSGPSRAACTDEACT